jgi:sodium/proline symporter
MSQFFAIALYIAILFTIGFTSVRRQQTAQSYLLGNRGLNFWLTALAAHASDMSTWLFMGLPALAYTQGLYSIWTAVGLILFMYLNWQLVAPRIRRQTEHYGSLTFSSFFESRFHDTSGLIRLFTALMSLIFYLFYISAGLYGLGIVIEQLFGLSYHIGITIGIAIMIPYLFYGGYTTLAWIDLFQGLFLLVVIVLVPLCALPHTATIDIPVLATSPKTIFYAICGFGLGYFGQPHIATKFMGIKNPNDIPKSMCVGMGWQTIVLSAALLIGILATSIFPSIDNPELIFVRLVGDLFPT